MLNPLWQELTSFSLAGLLPVKPAGKPRSLRTREVASLEPAEYRVVETLERRILLSAWTGDAHSSSWGDPHNWSGDAVPGPGDNVVVSGAGVQYASGTIGSLTVVSGSVSTYGAAALDITGNVTLDDGSVGSATVTGNVTVTGTGGVSGIIYGNVDATDATRVSIGSMVGGTIDLADGAVLTVSGSLTDVTINGSNFTLSGGHGTNVLDGVTINGNVTMTAVTSDDYFKVRNGLTLNGTATLSGAYDYSVYRHAGFLFDGNQTLGGSATIVFGNTATPANILAVTGGTTLTIGGGITVRGYSGTLGYVSGISGVANNSTISVVNEGTIQADAGATAVIVIDGTNNQNLGSLDALNGGTLGLAGSMSNASGAISADPSSRLNVTGTLTDGIISAGTDATVYAYGSLAHVTINGSNFTLSGGHGTNVLDGVTINGNVTMTAVTSDDYFKVRNGLTLNGTATLSGAYDYSVYRHAGFLFDGNQTLGGSATIVFGNTATPANILAVTGGTTLTIGGGITVRGYSGTLGYVSGISGVANNSTISVVNEGTIQADAGATAVIVIDGTNNQNLGSLDALNGGTLGLAGSMSNASGAISADPSSRLNVTGTLTDGIISAGTDATVYAYGSLAHVTINGSNFTLSGGHGTNVLDGVTINGNVTMTAVTSDDYFKVRNGLTLNGTATLSGAYDYSVYRHAGFLFDGNQTLGGSATIVFGNTATPANILAVTGGTTLTIGGGITVRGYSGTLGYVSGISGVANNSTISVVNEGTIQADAGATAVIVIDGTNNQNLGSLDALNGGTLGLAGSMSNASGAISADPSSRLNVTGTLTDGIISAGTDATVYAYGSLAHVTINGSNFTLSGGHGTNVLDGVTINGNVTMTAVTSDDYFKVRNGLTLNGTATLSGAYDYSVYRHAGFLFDGNQTLGGARRSCSATRRLPQTFSR